ncbi:MAG: aldo/keto reductase [Clostridia bacterium]|nr:aldo/keto reductase [Clostridia bacterium]
MEQDIKKLGFGLMRLPKKLASIDVEQTKAMVDLFLEAGFTYFDTAFLYPGSEAATKEALVDRYPRESYTLATKMNAAIPGMTEKMVKNEFETSLKRTDAGYFDYYLLHALQKGNVKRYDKLDIWGFVKEKKAQGLVKHYGFSFHDSPDLLDQLLTAHPDVDFVQLQINYADWEDKKVAARRNYEVARRHGKQIVVMEPVKGGKLAAPPKEVRKLMDAFAPGASYASWAIRFAASLPGVLTVLSGMSDLAQMQDNLSYMREFRPLGKEELEIIRLAQSILEKSAAVPCTACGYCLEGCPAGIPIPRIMEALNMHLVSGQTEKGRAAYLACTRDAGKASNCVGCKRCERICPQQLGITGYLKQADDLYGIKET